uniref:F-box protein family n=1 Tax=Solanum tuberosum TaxID=4113 RepID=M0ZU72_SOLTU
MEPGEDVDRQYWSNAPTDMLRLISSRLVAGEYVVFRAVCKNWRLSLPDLHDYSYSSPFSCVNTPCLITFYEETGDVEFFYPLYNAQITQNMDMPELRGSRIRCAIEDWLLMSKGDYGMFFFNPFTKVIMKLPDLLEEFKNSFPSWTFSCPQDSSSSDCFVVGFFFSGFPPMVYMIKVGESIWKIHTFYHDEYGNNKELFFVPHSPVYFKNDNIVYILGHKGTLAILKINENSTEESPTWKFHGKQLSHRKQNSIRQIFTAEDIDNGGILVIFLTHEEGKVDIWRYKMNGEELEKEKVTTLEDKTLFVSYGGSFLKPSVARGLANKIYFPMFHDNNKGVFYCLEKHKYYSFDYSSTNCFNLVQPISSIWIQPSSRNYSF